MGKLALVVGLIAIAACTPPKVVDAPEPKHDATRLSHDQHRAIDCVKCHVDDKPPGTHDHAPCDECHAAAFTASPGPLCSVCHKYVRSNPIVGGDLRPGGAIDTELKPFPRVDDAWRAEPSKFSHALHLDTGRMEKTVGFHVGCTDCHERDGALAPPDHATCSRCHAPEAGLSRAPAMTACAGCHTTGERPRARTRLIKGDLKFHHEVHRNDVKGHAIRCEQCHPQSNLSRAYEDHPPPRIESCVACHDDPDRAPNAMRMRQCETCHSTKVATLASLAPRNHLPLTERPLDHTLAFRRDHAEVAEQQASRCAQCHTQMSGNAHDACDECHQTMTPADHRITWREYDHGPEAIADRNRCARCHVVEFCTACHSQRPRSHGIAGSFASDHGPLARLDVRACLSCHVESFCDACHRTRSTR